MNILELAILKKMVGGGGGSGTDNYNDLSNLPQINGETLAGNKTAENLGLQDALTFDSTPTEDSTNPVESGGVYNALAGKQDNLTFDDDPTENSTNPVKSGGVYSALAGKQDNLTFDGVYNASTNKAATESTVTNAIAGLDVSAFSFDADETISSISETDGKVSVTKQDIAIASNQVVAMTGYTKPSSAPATPAIQQGDTANAAIGKLEYKADVNQSNILYGLETGAANYAPLEGDSKTGSGYFLNATSKGMNVIPSGTTVHIYCEYAKITNTQCSIQLTNVNGDVIGSTTSYAPSAPTSGTISADVTPSVDAYGYNAYYNGASGNTCTITKVMICPKNVWDAIQKYVPYSVPNYDLTRLEAEDRASLAEVVDSGAKNLLNFDLTSLKALNTSGTWSGNSYTKNGVTFTYNDSTKTILTYGTSTSGTTIFYLMNFTPTSGKSFIISGCPSGGSAGGYRFCNMGLTWANDYGSSDTAVGDGTLKEMAIYINNSGTAVGTSSNPLTWNLMICTKAAFGVSNKFVPYRPNYDLVCQSLPYIIRSNIATSTDYTLISALPIVLTKVGAYRISAFQDYSYTNPRGIIISRSNSDYTESMYVLAKSETSSDVASLSTSCLLYHATTTATNLYIWAKAKTVSSNQMGVILEYLG